MKMIDGSICAPHGFLAAGLHAGIRKNPQKPDLALIFSQRPAAAAGVFTQNKIKAAPLLLTQKHLKNGVLQAIIVNSGNANACTGKQGMLDAKEMAKITSETLNIDVSDVAVASTGVIGVPLPVKKIIHAVALGGHSVSKQGHDAAAEAIMTTDIFAKAIAIELEIGGKMVRIGGIAKGSGMIHPNMATMLAFITTDAAISHEALQQALSTVNQKTFNMVSVDGDTSTNDMVVILANGMAQNPQIQSAKDPDWAIFCQGLSFLCTFLAKEIARDGEGATKLLEIHVAGAATEKQAQLAARAISSSPLVKTAIFGEDANWGRIACAVGYSGAKIKLDKLSVELDSILLFKNGVPLPFDEVIAKQSLQQKIIRINVHLGVGSAEATAWGCDLTYDYIKINASYRS